MSTVESHPDVEELIEECERHGADVNKQKVRREYNGLTTGNLKHMEALRAVESNITERSNLPKTIKFGQVSPREESNKSGQDNNNSSKRRNRRSIASSQPNKGRTRPL